MQQTYTVTNLVRRINRRMAKFQPAALLYWDYRKCNYYLLVNMSNPPPVHVPHAAPIEQAVYGPVYHKDLLAFATYVNIWKPQERHCTRFITCCEGTIPEGRLRPDLQIFNHTRQTICGVTIPVEPTPLPNEMSEDEAEALVQEMEASIGESRPDMVYEAGKEDEAIKESIEKLMSLGS